MNTTLPKEWSKGTLKEIVYSVKTGVPEFKGEREYYSTGSIQNKTLIPEGAFSYKNRPSRANRIATKGDVFQARMKETDKGLIVDNKLSEQLFSTGFLQLRPFGQTYLSQLLYYYIISPIFLNQKDELATGSTQEALTDTNAVKLSFLLPPLNEQKRIVAKLDKIIPRIDAVKERMDKLPAIIKRFRQSVLTAAVTGKLTEKWREEHPDVESAEVLLSRNNFSINLDFRQLSDIPEKWCWRAFGNYADLSRGRFSVRPRNDSRYYNGKYPFIQIGDLPKEGGFVKKHNQTLNEKGLRVSKQFDENTIAIAIVGATIGNTGILSYNMCFPDSLVGIGTPSEYTSLYADYYLRTEKENIRNISYSSGGQPNIKLPTLTDYPFPLPPLEEQKEIVRQADKLFAIADKLESHYQNSKAKIDKLSQSVLAKAFRGELVPQNPNDEPAEKLLERIQEEKAKMEAELKKAKKKVSKKKRTK